MLSTKMWWSVCVGVWEGAGGTMQFSSLCSCVCVWKGPKKYTKLKYRRLSENRVLQFGFRFFFGPPEWASGFMLNLNAFFLFPKNSVFWVFFCSFFVLLNTTITQMVRNNEKSTRSKVVDQGKMREKEKHKSFTS